MTKWRVGIARSEESSDILELPPDASPLVYCHHFERREIKTGTKLDYEHHELIYICPVVEEKP